jgi:hypothetical protein
MKLQTAAIYQIADFNGLSQLTLQCANPVIFVPGQYIALWLDGQPDALPYTPFIQSCQGNLLTLAPDKLPAWQPGHVLGWRGPLGQACALTAPARRLALYSRCEHPGPLMPFIHAATQDRMDIVFSSAASGGFPAWLPAQIEWQDASRLSELAAWADVLVACLPRQALAEDLLKLSELPASITQGGAYVLVVSDMPCAGMAQCGVCDILARRKYIHVCQDGPLFPLKDLI